MSSSFPFYSSQVREALEEIISNHPQEERASSSVATPAEAAAAVARFSSKKTTTTTTTAIRGKKLSGGYESSSSENDNDNDDDGDNGKHHDDDVRSRDDDESTSSSSSNSSMEAVDEENEESSSTAPTADETNAAKQQRQGNGNNGSGNKRNNKKSKNNKSRGDDLRQKMGTAPSILLPLQYNNNNTSNKNTKKASSALTSGSQKALEIPTILLPNNYLRENPNYNVSSVAKELLSTWDQLNSNNSPSKNNTIVVVLLQSGRFAAAVFSLQTTNNKNNNITMKMVAHKTSTRYTVRKGQGGAQSSHDQSKNKANSIGAQLRREGEKQLRVDVTNTWKEWKKCGYVGDENEKSTSSNCTGVYVSCPQGMRRDYLFGGERKGEVGVAEDGLVEKGDGRLRNIPLAVGRPTMEACGAVLDCVLSCSLREMTKDEQKEMYASSAVDEESETKKKKDGNEKKIQEKKEVEMMDGSKEATPEAPPPPYTPLHQAVMDGDLTKLLELLTVLDESEEKQHEATNNDDDSNNNANNDNNQQPTMISYDVNTTAGPDHQTPLHLASLSTHANSTSLIDTLLIQGHADPCAVDTRGRPPYFLAATDKHREVFRLARGTLGEEYCSWEDGAKVGPPLTKEDVASKKAKAAEKKRKQRARQKEKKAVEKQEAEKEAAKKKGEEEKKKREEDAKRVRDGLKPKTSGGASNTCDFCQKVVKGKRRSQMFQRLEYAYCSTDCVKRHQRELMAAAATARMGTYTYLPS